MAVAIVSPAPFLAARALFEAMTRAKPLANRVATYQLALGDTHGIVGAGALLCVIGFWQLGGGDDELFMGVAAPELVRPHAVAVQRAGRLIVRRRLQDADVDRIVAWVASVQDPGGRLARAAGLVPLTDAGDAPGALLLMELRK